MGTNSRDRRCPATAHTTTPFSEGRCIPRVQVYRTSAPSNRYRCGARIDATAWDPGRFHALRLEKTLDRATPKGSRGKYVFRRLQRQTFSESRGRTFTMRLRSG